MALISIITKLTETYFPKKKMTRKQYKLSKKPWISKAILVSINHQKQLYAKTTKNFNTEAVYEYKRYRNKLTHIKEAAKHLHFKKVFNDSACNNPSNTWKYINKVLRKTKTSATAPVTLINSSGQTIISPEEICNEFNHHFTNIG